MVGEYSDHAGVGEKRSQFGSTFNIRSVKFSERVVLVFRIKCRNNLSFFLLEQLRNSHRVRILRFY